MVAPPTGRPAGPPPAPVFATTGNARADSVLATLDATIAPFTQAPPAEQGAAGWVAQGLGGALGVVNAPMMFIDAAASQGVSAVLDALGLAGLFPPMPVATIGLCMHLGTPHTHVHPPSLIPPAPPIPLPSLGVAFLAGAASVLVGGVPALRAGDIGIGLTCGSMAPPFEIMTGASGVYFAGARVARIGMDITFHCNPASAMGGFAIGMGVAGVVAGVAGAAAQASAGNSGAAIAQGIQAGLDAAAMAVGMLRGKDPAGPPGIGMLLGPPMGNVMAGGPPIPNVGALAQGKIYSALGRAMKSMRGRLRQRGDTPDGNCRNSEAGEPVNVVTGENYNTHLDFASHYGGFEWQRFTSSANCAERGVLGWGWRHVFEARLVIRLDRVTFEGFEGEVIVFPRMRDEDEVTAHGYRLQRLASGRMVVRHRRLGALEFERDSAGSGIARLVGVHRERASIELQYDGHRRLETIVERSTTLGAGSASYSLRYRGDGYLAEIWGGQFGKTSERLVTYHYDHFGNLVQAEDAAGVSEAYEVDPLHRLSKATDRAGYAFSFEYDHEGRCIKTQGADGMWFAELAYEPGQTTTTIHDGSNYVYTYDEDGIITSIVGPCGDEKKRLRDETGRVIAEVESGGQRTDFLYDADGGLIARRNRFGHQYPSSLDVPGVPNTFARHLPEDTRGFLFGAVAREGASKSAPVEVRRDLRGNVVYQRDARGREQHWSFDAAGNATGRTDRDGRTWQTRVARWGLKGAEVDPLGHATRYEHNPHQKITRVVDPGGSESGYVYDSHDRVVEVHRHGRLYERYHWDDGHHLVEKFDADGESLYTITPHANGLPGRIDRCDGGFDVFDYDRHGKVTRADTADHVVERGWTDAEELHFEDCDHRIIERRYSLNGYVATQIANRFVTQRERVGNVLRLIDPTGGVREIRHERDGSVEIDHGNGTIESQTYDDDGHLTARSCSRPQPRAAERVHWGVRYEYTAEGDLVRCADTVRGESRYAVDDAHRLVGVRKADGTVASYAYDAASNLTEIPGVGTLDIDTGNRLRTAAIEQFSYDERARVQARVGVAGSEVRYHYDAEDQLVRVEDGSDEDWTATYDALGRRVTFGRGDARTYLWWDRDRLAARHNADGSFRIYQYTDPDSLVPVGFIDYDSVDAEPESGRRYTVFSDQVGLPQHIEDNAGKVVWWAEYTTPYGEIFVRPGNEVDYHLRFVGQIYDSDIALHYNRFRDYDPSLGRYLQSDPLGVRGSLNLYAYPSNPLVAVDILGLSHPPRDGDAPKDGDGESRPRQDDPNDSADAPVRMTRAEAAAKAEAAAEAHRVETTKAFDEGRLPGFEEGTGEKPPACVAAVVDRTRPDADAFVAHNDPKSTRADPDEFHPVLADRIREQQQRQADGLDHFSEPGTHAEVKALDAAIKAREAETGVPVTEADLGDFVQLPVWNRDGLPGDRTPGTPAACCGHCAPITRGSDNLSGDATPFVFNDGRWQRVE